MAMKQELLYEGKAKRVYKTDEENCYWVEYKDDATAFNGEKKGTIVGKGQLNNQISAIFFEMLNEKGIPNHFIRSLSHNEQLVKKVTIIPLEVVIRNVAAGSLAKRLGLEEGTALSHPVVELYYKNDSLGDPLINESHVSVLQLATPPQVTSVKEIGLRVNDVLRPYLAERNVKLIDFKLEFGIDENGDVLLADEISPDTCRFWDSVTNEKLDKDRFRRDLGNVEDAYKEMLHRLGGELYV